MTYRIMITTIVLGLTCVNGWAVQSIDKNAQEAIPGVSNDDLQAVRQWWKAQGQTSPVPTQAARVLWRVSRLSEQFFNDKLQQDAVPSPALAHAIKIAGEAVAVEKIKIPERLAESFDFAEMWLVNVMVDDEEQGVLCKQIPAEWKSAKLLQQPMQASGFVVASASPTAPRLIVCRNLEWFPAETDDNIALPRGWMMLSKAGFDVGQFELIKSRNRSALSSTESSAFYDFVKSADLASQQNAELPKVIRPQDLLGPKESKKLIGHFVRLRLETARIQQIVDPALRPRIGQDHYWEIDAFGDLDNAQVRIEPQDGGQAIEFGNRYPVTLAMLNLPPFLADLVSDDGRVTKAMLMHKAMIDVDGFFYRLWTYETDFVSSKGGDRQIGPLFAATRITQRGTGSAEASLKRFGWGIAIAFLVGLLATVGYLIRVGRIDRQVRHVRKVSLPDVLPKVDDAK